MPVHVIAGHLVIISAPISVLLALVYATRPKARAGMRWPLVVSAVLSFALAVWAEVLGSDLYHQLEQAGPARAGAVAPAYLHAKAGDLLTVSTLVLAVLVVGALAVAWYTADTLALAMQAVWTVTS